MAGTHRPTKRASSREPVNQRLTDRTKDAKPAMRNPTLARWNGLIAVLDRVICGVLVAVMS